MALTIPFFKSLKDTATDEQNEVALKPSKKGVIVTIGENPRRMFAVPTANTFKAGLEQKNYKKISTPFA